mmetsp:Transcript_82326/g.233195  ORF Transcript_82326/g.233195 Transcript_82326/m.233195 type:complete len:205 (+) Transcript_82326:1-615(+)
MGGCESFPLPLPSRIIPPPFLLAAEAMGGCESCASSRRKEVAMLLSEKMARGSVGELRSAIEHAEAMGLETMPARRQYSELEKMERHSPERAHEMLRWAMSTQDGVIMYNVIQEVDKVAPGSEELMLARQRLQEHQDDARVRLQRLAKSRDARGMAVMLDRARHMGVNASDLGWAEQYLRSMEEAQAVRRDFAAAQAVPAMARG